MPPWPSWPRMRYFPRTTVPSDHTPTSTSAVASRGHTAKSEGYVEWQVGQFFIAADQTPGNGQTISQVATVPFNRLRISRWNVKAGARQQVAAQGSFFKPCGLALLV